MLHVIIVDMKELQTKLIAFRNVGLPTMFHTQNWLRVYASAYVFLCFLFLFFFFLFQAYGSFAGRFVQGYDTMLCVWMDG